MPRARPAGREAFRSPKSSSMALVVVRHRGSCGTDHRALNLQRQIGAERAPTTADPVGDARRLSRALPRKTALAAVFSAGWGFVRPMPLGQVLKLDPISAPERDGALHGVLERCAA